LEKTPPPAAAPGSMTFSLSRRTATCVVRPQFDLDLSGEARGEIGVVSLSTLRSLRERNVEAKTEHRVYLEEGRNNNKKVFVVPKKSKEKKERSNKEEQLRGRRPKIIIFSSFFLFSLLLLRRHRHRPPRTARRSTKRKGALQKKDQGNLTFSLFSLVLLLFSL
jgi:hypothetical protein